MNIVKQFQRCIYQNCFHLKSFTLKSLPSRRTLMNVTLDGKFGNKQNAVVPMFTLQCDVQRKDLSKREPLSGPLASSERKGFALDGWHEGIQGSLWMLTSMKRNITEPVSNKSIIESPINDLSVGNLQLPPHVTRELIEYPVVIEEKKALLRILKIRKRKMKRHKWKKLQKKMKFVFLKKKLRRKAAKEKAFMSVLTNVVDEAENFSAAMYVKDRVSMLNWKPPVTRVYGRLAPKCVIDDHLHKERLKEFLDSRIEECMRKAK